MANKFCNVFIMQCIYFQCFLLAFAIAISHVMDVIANSTRQIEHLHKFPAKNARINYLKLN